MICKANKNIIYDGKLVLVGEEIDVPEKVFKASVKGTLTPIEKPVDNINAFIGNKEIPSGIVQNNNIDDSKFTPVTALVKKALSGEKPYINTLNRDLLNEYATNLGVEIVEKKADLFNLVVEAVKSNGNDND